MESLSEGRPSACLLPPEHEQAGIGPSDRPLSYEHAARPQTWVGDRDATKPPHPDPGLWVTSVSWLEGPSGASPSLPTSQHSAHSRGSRRVGGEPPDRPSNADSGRQWTTGILELQAPPLRHRGRGQYCNPLPHGTQGRWPPDPCHRTPLMADTLRKPRLHTVVVAIGVPGRVRKIIFYLSSQYLSIFINWILVFYIKLQDRSLRIGMMVGAKS